MRVEGIEDCEYEFFAEEIEEVGGGGARLFRHCCSVFFHFEL